jgi:hypothetical protein
VDAERRGRAAAVDELLVLSFRNGKPRFARKRWRRARSPKVSNRTSHWNRGWTEIRGVLVITSDNQNRIIWYEV